MGFQRILCPTDFSTGSKQALRVAAQLAIDHGAELDIVHAWHVPAIAYSEYTFPADTIQGMQDDARRGLDEAVREASTLGVSRVTSKMLVGVPWAQVVAYMEHHPIDLCVTGTHGRTGLKRVLLGSVAEKLVRHAPCSVLAVRPDSDQRKFRRVLVPTDFSESAMRAAARAATLVAPDGELVLLHVLELPLAYSRDMPLEYLPALERRVTASLETEGHRLESATRASVKSCVRMGRPGAETLQLLEEDQDIDLVVMGSHGRTGLARVLMGSVAEKVVRHAPCPVLVAR